jgi:TetR/AcrR family transcriptional regulator, upper aerobic nicotinate degradation pathway regulator
VQLILDSALDLFARENYASVTTRDIAAACGVNVALIYYYFKNKDGLFRAVIKHAIDHAYSTYRSRTRDIRDPVQGLVEWFQVNLDQFTQLKKMAQICVAYNSAGRKTPEVDALIKDIYVREQRLLFNCVKLGVASGDFRKVDPKDAATFISNHLDGLCFVSMTRPKTDMKPLMTLAQDVILQYLVASR